MYVCVYVCMHACMYACMHACMHVYITAGIISPACIYYLWNNQPCLAVLFIAYVQILNANIISIYPHIMPIQARTDLFRLIKHSHAFLSMLQVDTLSLSLSLSLCVCVCVFVCVCMSVYVCGQWQGSEIDRREEEGGERRVAGLGNGVRGRGRLFFCL